MRTPRSNSIECISVRDRENDDITTSPQSARSKVFCPSREVDLLWTSSLRQSRLTMHGSPANLICYGRVTFVEVDSYGASHLHPGGLALNRSRSKPTRIRRVTFEADLQLTSRLRSRLTSHGSSLSKPTHTGQITFVEADSHHFPQSRLALGRSPSKPTRTGRVTFVEADSHRTCHLRRSGLALYRSPLSKPTHNERATSAKADMHLRLTFVKADSH